MKKSYYTQKEMQLHAKTKELLKELPAFASDFFIAMENTTTALTRINYLYDLRIFFYYLFNQTGIYNGKTFKELKIKDLNEISSTTIEGFLSFLTSYNYLNKQYVNSPAGKSRKLSTIRSFLGYFFDKNLIVSNEADKVKFPKLREKPIVRLETDEIVKILNTAEDGSGLTKTQQVFHNHTRMRDLALLTLLLGTGLRVSECAGLNLSDVDFEVNSLKVTRKGGAEVILYFSDEVKNALESYLSYRELNLKQEENPALFVSLQNTRLSTRAMQNIVKKYAKIISPLKKISPHKLRSTFGTELYRETGDIYVVADVLGHKDINTTKKHYAAISDDLRRRAAFAVKLKK